MNLTYSVLMLLWYKEKPSYLKAAIESMTKQSAAPSEFVFVKDHDISDSLQKVIDKAVGNIPVRYVDAYSLYGRGLGALRAIGVTNCSSELIACLDTDDISFPDRCEKQLKLFEKDSELAIVGGTAATFSTSPECVTGYFRMPSSNKEIIAYTKEKCPFMQSAVMFRKAAVLDIGNFNALYKGCEDYELYVRLIDAGYKAYNIYEPIVYYRAGEDLLKKRNKSKITYFSYKMLRKSMYEKGNINLIEYIWPVVKYTIFYKCPYWFVKLVCIILRKKMYYK
jgi:glycosyltransferase involved in cell wall biosynthesis